MFKKCFWKKIKRLTKFRKHFQKYEKSLVVLENHILENQSYSSILYIYYNKTLSN